MANILGKIVTSSRILGLMVAGGQNLAFTFNQMERISEMSRSAETNLYKKIAILLLLANCLNNSFTVV